MSIDRDDVIYVARLARLDLSEDEVELFTAQLADILDNAERVASLDTDGVAPTSHPMEIAHILRADDVRPCLDRATVLSQAPDVESGYFKVPKILDTERDS